MSDLETIELVLRRVASNLAASGWPEKDMIGDALRDVADGINKIIMDRKPHE